MRVPETSVIIRAFNEEKYLPRLLEAIRRQTYQNYELILVDSGSTDFTREIARRYCDKVLQIDSHDFTFGYSLNVGIRSSAGRHIVIVSAHAEPVGSSWLQDLTAPLMGDQTAMVYGRQLGTPSSKFGEVRDFRRIFGVERRVLRAWYFANNANSAIRRDLWEQHPFNETVPGLEDIEWAKYWIERGYCVVYEPRAAIYHIHEETWRQVRRRYYREGVAARRIGIKGPNDIPLELLREAKHLLEDFLEASREGRLGENCREIVLFRVNKTVGTMRGLWDGTVMDDPQRREAMFFDRTSKAVVIHGPRRASLEEVEIPPVKPGDVLIKVAYEGVCGTDLEILNGTLGYYHSGSAQYPIIPGHEFSGRVVEVGPNVTHVKKGDPVVAECIQSCGECEQCGRENGIACPQRKEVGVIGRNGGYAEYIVLPWRFVHRFPDRIDMKKACLCEPLAVVLKAIRRLERLWSHGERKGCGIVGAGPIGHLCARILDMRGHQVTVFDRNPVRISYFEGTRIRGSCHLEGLSSYDALVEATGSLDVLDRILHDSRPAAALLLVGLPYSKQEFNFEEVVVSDKTILGSVGSSAEDFRAAIELLPRLDLDLFTKNVFPLEQFHGAWESCKAGQQLKTLLEVDRTLNADYPTSSNQGSELQD